MSTDTYRNELAQNLRQQLHALEQHSRLTPQTLAHVVTNVKNLVNGQRFAGWLRPLQNGQVLLLTSTYAPDNPSWAFHLHLVSSEGHFGTGHLLASFTEYTDQKKLFIGDFKVADKYQKAGTGSWVLATVLDFCHAAQMDLATGEIAGVDWDRVDMLEHFYTKHGFAVTPTGRPKSKSLTKNFHKASA